MAGDARQGAGLDLRRNPNDTAVIATVSPDAGAAPIDEAWLRQRLEELGCGDWRWLAPAATTLLAAYHTGRAVEVRLAERAAAEIQVILTPDGLEARLHIRPAEGGAPPECGQVLAALTGLGVVEGLQTDAIDAAVAAGRADGVLVARGRPAEAGHDGHLESLLPEVRSRVPRVDAVGHADYRDLGAVFVVHPGDPLMRRHPATPGRAGVTLLGKPIPARDGKEVMFAASLSGSDIAPDDPNLLRAAITGQPVAVRGGMVVEPVFDVEAVGTASGNIDFEGNVNIRGDVAAGMTVRATGDIEIGGVVENATLEAGGNIVIKGGALGSLGHKGSGEHRIRCGACFHATYVQQARVEAGDSIYVDDLAMQSELTAINHICIGHQRRGHIIGGTAQATLSITAKVIGSPNRARTVLEIGVNPLMHQQLLQLARERDAKENQLVDVSKLLDFAGKNPGKLAPAVLDKGRLTAAALAAAIADLRAQQDELTRKIELSMEARVEAQQAIHEGVEVIFGTQRYRVVGEHGPYMIGLDEEGALGHLVVIRDKRQTA